MFDAPPPIPPSCTGGKALGGGARLSPAGQNRPALSLAPCGLPVAASSSASCLKPWPPTSGCPGNRTPPGDVVITVLWPLPPPHFSGTGTVGLCYTGKQR